MKIHSTTRASTRLLHSRAMKGRCVGRILRPARVSVLIDENYSAYRFGFSDSTKVGLFIQCEGVKFTFFVMGRQSPSLRGNPPLGKRPFCRCLFRQIFHGVPIWSSIRGRRSRYLRPQAALLAAASSITSGRESIVCKAFREKGCAGRR